MAPSNQSTFTWTTTTSDPRALQVPGSSNRVAAVWLTHTSFTVDVNLGDGQAHDLELYFLDWDNISRNEKVQISDAASAAVLDTESIASFHGGKYLDWKVAGHIVITITYVGGPNAVLDGLFLDPVQVTNTSAVPAASTPDGGPTPDSSADSLIIPTTASRVTLAISQNQLADGSGGDSGPGDRGPHRGAHAGGKTHKKTVHPSGHDLSTTKHHRKATIVMSSDNIRSHLLLRRRFI